MKITATYKRTFDYTDSLLENYGIEALRAMTNDDLQEIIRLELAEYDFNEDAVDRFSISVIDEAPNDMNYETETFVTISTAHVTEAIMLALAENGSDVPTAFSCEYGAIFYAGDRGDPLVDRWPALLRIQQWARMRRILWVRLDRDGPVIDLPTFDW